ncbi:hypothetical protein AB0L14_21745 [Streptomyces sp. NPDC052727]|uniref:hypothetical protein n=1 Tax=Streptomyces sp. NPDC052727 TaxID=3154854 RepID=UPI003417DACB
MRAVAAGAAEEFTRPTRQHGAQPPSTTGMSLHEVNRMLAELTREKKSPSA